MKMLRRENGGKGCTDYGSYWRLKYRFDGREKLLAIGVHPEISLAQARADCDEVKALLRDNRDPNFSSSYREIGRPANCPKLPLLNDNQPLSITNAFFWGTQ